MKSKLKKSFWIDDTDVNIYSFFCSNNTILRLMKRIIILASGSGTNAENIINYFQTTQTALVTHVLCNNEHAKVIDRSKRLETKSLVFKKNDFIDTDTVFKFLKEHADYVILAGFLLKIPAKIVRQFPHKIINIHPALLPKYGGKGMYGMHVHKAVKANKEQETGITIHYVNEQYDEGAIIFQAKTPVFEADSPEDIAKKVHQLEQKHVPKIIERVILNHE